MDDIFFHQAERSAREAELRESREQQEEQKKEQMLKQKKRQRRSYSTSKTRFSEALESNSDELLQSTISEFMDNAGPNVPEFLTPVSPRHFDSSGKSTSGGDAGGGSSRFVPGASGRRRRLHNPTVRTLKAPYTGLNGLSYTLPREKVSAVRCGGVRCGGGGE